MSSDVKETDMTNDLKRVLEVFHAKCFIRWKWGKRKFFLKFPFVGKNRGFIEKETSIEEKLNYDIQKLS